MLVRACRKYRTTMPTYLQSAQAELSMLDELIKRLSEMCADPDPDDM